MQEAIPYRSATTWFPPPARGGSLTSSSSSCGGGGMRRMVAENPVVVVARSGCCMCHVARRLLLGLGVNTAVCEVGEGAAASGEAAALVEDSAEIEALGGDSRRPAMLPVVFVGGRLLGGIDRLVAVHITGELVPILKKAGALWL